MLALASSEAPAQTLPQTVTQSGPAFDVASVVKSAAVAVTARPLTATTTTASQPRSLMSSAMLPVQQAVTSLTGQTQTAVQALAPAIAREAAWLYRGGWPLYALVDRYSVGAPLDEEATCLATAVYFEARGESPEGQLAVARVVMNRAASGKYPPTWCSTVKQPWQFSFVRNGRFPAIDTGSRRVAQGAGHHPAGDEQRGAEPVERRPVVSRQLCRSVVGPAPDPGRKDRRAHLLPVLIFIPARR